MLWPKACPRCHGDLVTQSDEFGNQYVGCIQCGYIRYEEHLAARQEARRAVRPTKKAA